MAQAIPIAISPLLTRMYSPEEFGAFALFLALVTILGGVAAARYDMAIMLPNSQRDAETVAWLSGGITTLFSLLLSIPCIWGRETVASWFGDPGLAAILPWMPLAVWLLSLGAIFSALASRARQFSRVARANVLKSVSMSGVQLAAGGATYGTAGLVIGNLVGGVLLLLGLRNTRGGLSAIDVPQSKDVLRLAGTYKDFPKFSVWATFANGVSVNVLSLLLSTFYSLASLGFYNLVQRVLAAPSAVLGSAVGQVFYQRASVEFRESGTILHSFHSAWLRLLFISIPLFLPILFFADPVFAFIFGEDWRVAGHYAEILAPMFWIRFWVSPLSSTNQLLLQNRAGLIANLLLLMISASVVVYSAGAEKDVEDMLVLMNWTLVGFYFVFFVFLYSSARRSGKVRSAQEQME